MIEQLRRRKWNRLRHGLRGNDDKQALLWTCKAGEEENTWKKDLEKELYGRQVSAAAGRRWRRQHKTEVHGDK